MEVQEQFGEDVQIVGVPGLSNIEAMQNFVLTNGVDTIPHINDQGELWERFGVTEQRTYIYINNDGTSTRATYGSLPSDVEDLIAR